MDPDSVLVVHIGAGYHSPKFDLAYRKLLKSSLNSILLEAASLVVESNWLTNTGRGANVDRNGYASLDITYLKAERGKMVDILSLVDVCHYSPTEALFKVKEWLDSEFAADTASSRLGLLRPSSLVYSQFRNFAKLQETDTKKLIRLSTWRAFKKVALIFTSGSGRTSVRREPGTFETNKRHCSSPLGVLETKEIHEDGHESQKGRKLLVDTIEELSLTGAADTEQVVSTREEGSEQMVSTKEENEKQMILSREDKREQTIPLRLRDTEEFTPLGVEDTVGLVQIMPKDDTIRALTSSGGNFFKVPGRISCAGVLGAGVAYTCYGLNQVTVMCTGNGEDIMRMNLAGYLSETLAKELSSDEIPNSLRGALGDTLIHAILKRSANVPLSAVDANYLPTIYVGAIAIIFTPNFKRLVFCHSTESFYFGFKLKGDVEIVKSRKKSSNGKFIHGEYKL